MGAPNDSIKNVERKGGEHLTFTERGQIQALKRLKYYSRYIALQAISPHCRVMR